jgi:energy-coupling factor transporter transmembrane protein EcfT
MKGKTDNIGAGILIGIVVAVIFIMLMLIGCTTTKYVETVRTDTLKVAHIVTDSVWVYNHDSIVINQQSDTVKIERWHWRDRWRDRVSHDTIYQSKTDTVKVESVNRHTEKGLTWWQKFRIHCGNIFIIALIAAAIIVLLKIRKITIL